MPDGYTLLASFATKASSIKWIINEQAGPYVRLYEHDNYAGNDIHDLGRVVFITKYITN